MVELLGCLVGTAMVVVSVLNLFSSKGVNVEGFVHSVVASVENCGPFVVVVVGAPVVEAAGVVEAKVVAVDAVDKPCDGA